MVANQPIADMTKEGDNHEGADQRQGRVEVWQVLVSPRVSTSIHYAKGGECHEGADQRQGRVEVGPSVVLAPLQGRCSQPLRPSPRCRHDEKEVSAMKIQTSVKAGSKWANM